MNRKVRVVLGGSTAFDKSLCSSFVDLAELDLRSYWLGFQRRKLWQEETRPLSRKMPVKTILVAKHEAEEKSGR